MKQSSEERCIHRHTREEHPNCFDNGLVVRNDWWRNLKIGYLDIEVTNLNADWGFMLSWCIKERGKSKVLYDIITKKEIYDGSYDKRIVKSLLDRLSDFDVIVTYYGKRFDVPFMRARALYYGMDFPHYSSIYHWDLYFYVRRMFKVSSRKLANITKFLGISGKTPLDGNLVRDSSYGQAKALKEMLVHNKGDVVILEELHNELLPYAKWIKTSL